MRLHRPTLRTKLAAFAAVGTVILATLGLLLIVTAHDAQNAVEKSQRRYALVSVYASLLDQTSGLRDQAWVEARDGLAGPSERTLSERERFVRLLTKSEPLALAAGPEHARVNKTIRQQAQAALATYDGFDRSGLRIREISRTQGYQRATEFSDQTLSPFFALERTVKAELDAGDRFIAQQTQRAADRTGMLVMAACASLFAGLLLMAVQFRLIFGRLRRGLERLEHGVRAFAAGDLGKRVNLEGADELTRLSDVFDAMAAELAARQAALEAAKDGLETAVAERTRELEAANAALAAEDGRRRRFLADVGHELRTPLTIIRGEVQVALRAAERGRADPSAVLGRILEQTQGMGRLVEDLFLIARAEAGGLSLQRQAVDLTALADRVAHDFEALAAERSARVVAKAGPPVWADADFDRIRQAVAALIDNALRHTRPGVRVEVAASVGADGAAVISVADDGPGVPEDDAEELFGRFRRGETRGDGSGLGLSVVRALAEAHGGSAEIANRPGGGALACVRLPAAQVFRAAG